MSWGIKIAGTPDNVIAAMIDPALGAIGMTQGLKDSVVAVANEVKAGSGGYFDGVYVDSCGHIGGNSSDINKHEVYAIKLAPPAPVAASAEAAPAADTDTTAAAPAAAADNAA